MILNQMLSTHFQQFKIKNLKLRMAWNLQQSRPGRRPNSWAKYEFCAQVLRCGWIIWNLGARIQKYVLRSWCGIPACFVDWTFQYINAVESAESHEKKLPFPPSLQNQWISCRRGGVLKRLFNQCFCLFCVFSWVYK